MSAEELMHVKGMNKQTAVLLSMIPQLAARLEADSFGKRPKLDSYEKMEQYARIKYYGKTVETVNVFCLDKNWYLNGMETVATGTIDQVSVYPREIVKQALRYDAAKVIVTHNHPSGRRGAQLRGLCDDGQDNRGVSGHDHQRSCIRTFACTSQLRNKAFLLQTARYYSK